MAAKTYTLTGKSTVQNREKDYRYEKGDQISAAEYKKLINRHKKAFTEADSDSEDESEDSKSSKGSKNS